jgi:hypothetical protein
MRILCEKYLRRRHVSAAEVTADELLSEIWQKLLGTVSLGSGESAFPAEWTINLDAPEHDGRVVWLLREIGGSDAIAHRHEDILRQRHGRFQHGRGRPITQLEDEDESTEIASEPDQPITLQYLDAHRVWRGMFITANSQFQSQDDVLLLLRVMDDVRDILEESSGQWPIKRMVDLLNNRFAPPPWTNDRVDNAKRRLVHWIKRLMQTNGFDTIDLEDLFARVARNQEKGARLSPPKIGHRGVN